MGRRILNSKILYAVLAVILSIGLWVYVVAVEGTDSTIDISGIPVTFTNQEVLEERGLMITEGEGQTVTLTVSGASTSLTELSQRRSDISVTVDVGRITSPGSQQMAYTVTLPSGYSSSVTISDRSPGNIDFTVSRFVTEEIEIGCKFDGTLADGYMRDDFIVTPSTLTIYGAEEEVENISYALVTVQGEDLSESVTEVLPFTLMNAQGQETSSQTVTCSVETVEVTMPVVKSNEIKLAVDLIPGGGITEENMDKYVTCTIDPAEISVSGLEEDLESLDTLTLGEIDLNEVSGTENFEFEIPLESNLKNISGITSASVTVTISDELETEEYEVDTISLRNVPDGFKAESVTQNLQVQVRGTEDALEELLESNLRAVADLSEIEDPAAGRYTVHATIYLDTVSDDIGVLGDDYEIVVDLEESG